MVGLKGAGLHAALNEFLHSKCHELPHGPRQWVPCPPSPHIKAQPNFCVLQGALQLVPLALEAGDLSCQAGGALVAVVGSQRQGSILLLQLSNAGLRRLSCCLLLHQLRQRGVAVGAGTPRLRLGGVASGLCRITCRGIAARLALQLQEK